MRLETTLSQLYVNAYLTKSRRVEKVASRGNGQQEKPRCWQRRTKQPVADTKAKPIKKGLVDISI
jgi:hypothetical protein